MEDLKERFQEIIEFVNKAGEGKVEKKPRVFLSRSVYETEERVARFKREWEAKGYSVVDGVELFQAAVENGLDPYAACLKAIERVELCVFVPVLTPGVRKEYESARRLKKKCKILRGVLR